MAHPQAIEVLVRRVARQVGVRRAEHWGLRGAFWGALLAAAVLAFKAVLGLAALVLAPALVLLGPLAGAAYALARPLPPRGAGQHLNDGGAVAAAAEGPPQAAVVRGARLRAAHRYGQRVDRG